MVLWLLVHIILSLIDAVTAVLPQSAIAFLIIHWIFLELLDATNFLEIRLSFYQWGYMLPASSTWAIIANVWSDRSTPGAASYVDDNVVHSD